MMKPVTDRTKDDVAGYDYIEIFRAVLTYARARDYTGWDLYDGESSRLLQALPLNNRWLNLAVQQLVRRAPVNLRPLLLVEQRRNFKGAALFALSSFMAYELTGDQQYLAEARSLVDWLVEYGSKGYSGFCGGHNHPVQQLDRRVAPKIPGVVGTSYAVRALLQADKWFADGVDGKRYGDIALSSAAFVLEDLDYTKADEGATIKYRPDTPDDYVTLNANALGARLLLDLHEYSGHQRYRRAAEGLLDFVAAHQTDVGGWPYRVPSTASHLSMDNYHNGFIIESYAHHREIIGTDRYKATLHDAVDFYRTTLFEPDGAPNYDESTAYPRDIHAVAQGAITFANIGKMAFAQRILDWGFEHLYAGDGRFYVWKGRFVTARITLMRWCQAWMAYALATYLHTRSNPEGGGLELDGSAAQLERGDYNQGDLP
jgi:hypothetical protein